jgi:hypothetical protein
MQHRIKLAALAMAGGTAALLLAGTPALASSHAHSQPVTGPEKAYGVIYGKPATGEQPDHPAGLGRASKRPRCLHAERPRPG